MDWFDDVISKEDQFEVRQAQLAIDIKFDVGCMVATMMPELIRERFGEDPFEGMKKAA